MDKLMDMAKRVSDQVEVYSLQQISDGVSFENAKLKDIESTDQAGVSLRIVKDGKLGFSYTKNLLNREELLSHAIDSLRGGVEAPLDFPQTKVTPRLETIDASMEGLSNATLVEECTRVCEQLKSRTTGQINLSAHRAIGNRRLINSQGTDLTSTSSFYSLGAEILYPGSYAAIHRPLISKRFEKPSEEHLNFMLELYNQSSSEITPPAGKMKVLFLPETWYTLLWRLESATNGRNIYQKTSPLLEKMGERIFDEKLTIVDDPLNDRLPGARGFDDEGIPCRPLTIIDRGVLKTFYYDLFYAKKLNALPTGHGYKSAMWGGETISFKPGPSLAHLHIKPGSQSFPELLRSLNKGVVIAGVMGAHSGNILNGDYSVGLSPGLYVERGEIVGRVKDAMVAGNIFDTLKNVIALEDTAHPGYGGVFPAVLFDNVSVATKH